MKFEDSLPPEFLGFKPIITKHFIENKELIGKHISSLVIEYDNKEEYVQYIISELHIIIVS